MDVETDPMEDGVSADGMLYDPSTAPLVEDGGSEGPGPDAALGAPAIPTREQIRDQIRGLIADGTITTDDVIVDMYASQYAIELMLGGFKESFDSFQHSSLGRMLTKRAAKEARKHGNQD